MTNAMTVLDPPCSLELEENENCLSYFRETALKMQVDENFTEVHTYLMCFQLIHY